MKLTLVFVALFAASATSVAFADPQLDAARQADSAAKKAIHKAGKKGLLRNKKLHFSFALGSLGKHRSCPKGHENDKDLTYCREVQEGGDTNFVMKFVDPRPGHRHKKVAVASADVLNLAPNSIVNMSAKIHHEGLQILRYALASHKPLKLQLTTQVLSSGATVRADGSPPVPASEIISFVLA
jgi:hypothetical protein